MKRYLLVDHENLPNVDLASAPADVTVMFFFGAAQRTVSKEFMLSALGLGPRFVPIDIGGQGRNALDFHIAFYLGEHLARDPGAECVILSRDKGFDPLVRHLAGRGFRVRRAAALQEAMAPASEARKSEGGESGASPAQRARAWLEKHPRPNRPRKRKGLLAALNTLFASKVSTPDLEGIIDGWIRQGLLVEEKGALSYRI